MRASLGSGPEAVNLLLKASNDQEDDVTMQLRKSIIGAAAALAIIPAGTALAATINGGPGNEHLRGTNVADVINGNGGNDRIFGLAGDDQLNGGPGNDRDLRRRAATTRSPASRATTGSTAARATTRSPATPTAPAT